MGKLLGNNKGQLLIEAMVAMGVISVGLLGSFSVLSNSLGISNVTSNQYVGTYLAAEGIEVVKNIIDTNVQSQAPWDQGLVKNNLPYSFTVQYNTAYDSTGKDLTNSPAVGTPLEFDPSTGLYSYDTGNPTVFTRTVTVTVVSPNSSNATESGDELQVESVVQWKNQGDVSDSVDLEDTFYNSSK